MGCQVRSHQDHPDRQRDARPATQRSYEHWDPREVQVWLRAAKVRDEVRDPLDSTAMADVRETLQDRLIGTLHHTDVESGKPCQEQQTGRDPRRGQGSFRRKAGVHGLRVAHALWRS
jgi:hypothetical protein